MNTKKAGPMGRGPFVGHLRVFGTHLGTILFGAHLGLFWDPFDFIWSPFGLVWGLSLFRAIWDLAAIPLGFKPHLVNVALKMHGHSTGTTTLIK